jgi:hypothetical protein
MHSVYSLDLGPCSVAYEILENPPDQQKKVIYVALQGFIRQSNYKDW